MPGFSNQTPWEIACEWYTVESIASSIRNSGSDEHWEEIPADSDSPEFARWLTNQYRLAMAKGIQLGRTADSLYVTFANKYCPRCDTCKSLLLDGGVVVADGITEKPCRVVCPTCDADDREAESDLGTGGASG